MQKRSDLYGTEFDWFATDADGFVALMSSAGYGPIPDCVFEQFAEQERIEKFFSQLIGQPQLRADWNRMNLSLSQSGVFMYEWKEWEGPYIRQGKPSLPLNIEQLGIPADLRASFAVLPERFSANRKLRPELLLACTG